MTNVASLEFPKSSDRDERGRWLTTPGRLPGSRNRVSAEALASIKAMGPDALIKLREHLNDKESASHWKACELVLKYILPPARTVELDNAEPATIMNAFIDGTLSSSEAKELATAIEKLRNVASIDDLMRGIEELKELAKQK